MKKRKTNPRRNLMIQLALDVLFITETCLMWSWGPSAHPPVRPWLSSALTLWCCGDTLRRVLRFRELTGHWPDLRKRDLGAEDIRKKEEKEP